MIYLRKFENHAAYSAATESGLTLPNVSLCVSENEVHYNPYVPSETRVIAKFNVTNISSPTTISYSRDWGFPIVDGTSGFSEIEIDGVVQPTIESAYTFSTLGEHTVKYTLADQTRIADYAFMLCTSLTNISIPNGVTSIGDSAFNNCGGLTSIDIPNGVTSIGNGAFQSCSGLTSIDIPNGVTSIGSYTFSSINVQSIIIPSGVTSIGMGAFNGCNYLTSIDIPSGVTAIDNFAFSNCSVLISIVCNALMPPTLGSEVFYGSSNLGSIYVPSGSVDVYKAASGWSDYASYIQAIQ